MEEEKLHLLKKLEQDIEKAKKDFDDKNTEGKNPYSSMASKVIAELIAGISAGALIGYFVDKYFSTWPLFLVICFICGMIASFVNINRMIK